MPYFRFTTLGLSDSMNAALTWLIEHGGQATPREIVWGGSGIGRRYATKVTDPTIEALIRRGLLVRGPTGQVQLTDKAVGTLCEDLHNPHPVPIMQARAELREIERTQ